MLGAPNATKKSGSRGPRSVGAGAKLEELVDEALEGALGDDLRREHRLGGQEGGRGGGGAMAWIIAELDQGMNGSKRWRA